MKCMDCYLVIKITNFRMCVMSLGQNLDTLMAMPSYVFDYSGAGQIFETAVFVKILQIVNFKHFFYPILCTYDIKQCDF